MTWPYHFDTWSKNISGTIRCRSAVACCSLSVGVEGDGPAALGVGLHEPVGLDADGLVDELVLPINPVLVGTGKRLFAEGTPGRTFELAGTTALPSGIVVCAYTLGEPLPLA